MLVTASTLGCGGVSSRSDDAGGSPASAGSGGNGGSGMPTAEGGTSSDANAGRGGVGDHRVGFAAAVTAGVVPVRDRPPPSLCELPPDGSASALTFAANTSGGNLNGEPTVWVEVGYNFLLIDGQCRYWAMVTSEKAVRSGSLSEEETVAFAEDLLLGQWSELPPPSYDCLDAPVVDMRFGDEHAPLYDSCTETELSAGYQTWLEALYERGTDLEADVRYTLAEPEIAWDPDLGLTWPLEGDPAEIAEPYHDSAEPLVASGEQSAALRSLRVFFESVQPGDNPWPRIPVVYEDGAATSYYELVLRDVTPFEYNGKLDPERFFE